MRVYWVREWRKLDLGLGSLSRSVPPVVIAIITLSTVVLPALIHTPLLAQSSSIDFSQEYSSGEVQIFPSLYAWYTWININATHTIFLALHSFQAPSPVSAFVGESYSPNLNSRVFVANALMAMEVYNDTNGNGFLDANYAIPQTELLYTIQMNASQTFTTSPVQKTITNNVPHYDWGVTYGSVQGDLITADPAYNYGYNGGEVASAVMIDHLSLFYDYSITANTTYLKTSYEIGNVTLVPPTLPGVTLKGLSLSLLHFVLAVSSDSYAVRTNGSSNDYNSQTSQTSTQVNTAQIVVPFSTAYKFLFNDNYTLQTNPPVSLRTVYAAASNNSLPVNAFQGQGALQVIRAQDYVKALLPDIAGIPSSFDLNFSVPKLIYRISYPTWGGVGIKHDPTYVAYYVLPLNPVSLPLWDPMIIIYLAVAVAAVAVAVFLVFKRTRRARTYQKLSGPGPS
jgi:hypothetical protein